MAGYLVVSLHDLIEEYGEDRVKPVLSCFSCPINRDVEMFLRNKAVEFERQALSKTHLIYALYKKENVLVAYYTLANKPLAVKPSMLSAGWKKRLRRFSQGSAQTGPFHLALPLI